MADARVVLTTVAPLESAEQLAATLVERRLAACVNIIGPIRSIYRWQDAVQREQEYLLLTTLLPTSPPLQRRVCRAPSLRAAGACRVGDRRWG